jgi:hypothetical protein
MFQLVNQFLIIKYTGELRVSTSGIVAVSLIVLVVLAVVGLEYYPGASGLKYLDHSFLLT